MSNHDLFRYGIDTHGRWTGTLTVSYLQVQGSQHGGTYSRPGAEPVVLGSTFNQHQPSDNSYSTSRIDRLGNEAGLANNRGLDTNSNPKSLSGNNTLGGMTQHDSGFGTGNAYTGASHSSEFGGNSSQYGVGQSSSHSRQCLSGAAPQGQSYGGQSTGFTQGYGQQSQAASMAEHAEYEPVTRLPSTGIPPVFHPPSYITSDVSSYNTSGGPAGYGSDAQGVNAKQALEPLTNLQAGEVSRDTSGVNAKQALEPLTHIAGGDSQEEAVGVHAKDALQPLTEVPAQENNKGFVESIREYLPGQQQTGAVEVGVDMD